MREIKYKAWCKDRNEWEKDNMCLLPNGRLMEMKTGHIVKEETHFVVFWTGLKDKNGKEIYEMDIVKIDWGGLNEEYIKVNKYDKPFVIEWRDYEYAPFSRCLPMPKNVEVLGNIYENPELLKVI